MVIEKDCLNVEEHIKEIEAVIKEDDQAKAKTLYDNLCNCYKSKISCFESGTNALFLKTNDIWNFNDGIDYVDQDYITDLKIILIKVKKYLKEQ